MRELGLQVYQQRRPVVLVFEGWDAAGKGGVIKRFTEKLDPRGFVVFQLARRTAKDKTKHYLYRFWRRLPERGTIAIFDRSWYGPCLGRTRGGLCQRERVEARLQEINAFERQLPISKRS